jgi:hypothetical protein
VGNSRSGNCGVEETNRKVQVSEIYGRSNVDVSINVVRQTLIIIIIIIIIILEDNSNYIIVVYSY